MDMFHFSISYYLPFLAGVSGQIPSPDHGPRHTWSGSDLTRPGSFRPQNNLGSSWLAPGSPDWHWPCPGRALTGRALALTGTDWSKLVQADQEQAWQGQLAFVGPGRDLTEPRI